MLTRHGTGKTQPAFAENALVWIRAQEAFHQHRKPGQLRFFPYRHVQRFVNLRQQRTPLAVGQKAGVAHHFKMPRRNVADIAPDHLFLTQRLAFMLSRAVIEVVVDHRAAGVMPQAGSRHRRALQITAEVFHAVPGSPGLLREVHLPVAAILCLQVTPPLALIADVAQPRQCAGPDPLIAAAQQADNGTPPDFLNGLLFEEKAAPDAVLNVEAATGDGDVDVRMLIQLPAVSMQGAEYANLNALPSCPAEHGTGGAAEQVVEQGPVMAEKGPQQVGHVGQDMLLLCDPLLGGLHAAGATGFRLAALAEKAGVCAVRRGAAVAAYAHGAGATGEHSLNGEAGPLADAVAVFFEVAVPAVIDGEEEFGGAGDVHGNRV